MAVPINRLRRDAKALTKACAAGEPGALARTEAVLGTAPKAVSHADARTFWQGKQDMQAGRFSSLRPRQRPWTGSRSSTASRWRCFTARDGVERLLEAAPDLRRDNLGILCAMYDVEGVREALEVRPRAGNEPYRGQEPRFCTWRFRGGGATAARKRTCWQRPRRCCRPVPTSTIHMSKCPGIRFRRFMAP